MNKKVNIFKKFGLIILTFITVLTLTTTLTSASSTNFGEINVDGTIYHVSTQEDIVLSYVNPAFTVRSGSFKKHLSYTSEIKILSEAYITLESNGQELLKQFVSEETILVHYNSGTDDYSITANNLPSISMGDYGEIDTITIEFLERVDNKRPAFSGQENFVVDVDDPKPISYFQKYLTAIDDVDGDVTDQIVIDKDNYTPNKSVLGTHSVIFSVTDSAGNKATLEVFIRVFDLTEPIISSPAGNTANVGYKETFNISTITNQLVVTDNYDSNVPVRLDKDNYSANKTKLGTYDLIYKATDNSDNTGSYTFKVNVIDNVKPTFSGPVTINKPNNSIMLEREIRSQIIASDEIDGNITSRIKLVSDSFTGNGSKVGSYEIKYEVSDNAGNKAYHLVTVKVQDNLPPIFWIEDGVSIRVSKDTPITRQQVIDLLTATGQLKVNSTTTFSFPLDEYTGSETLPGIYAMSIRTKNTNGEEDQHNLSIRVLSDESNEDDIIVDKEKANYIIPIIFGSVVLLGVVLIIRKKVK